MTDIVFVAPDLGDDGTGTGIAHDAEDEVAQILDDEITAVHDETVLRRRALSDHVVDDNLAVRPLDAAADHETDGERLVGIDRLVLVLRLDPEERRVLRRRNAVRIGPDVDIETTPEMLQAVGENLRRAADGIADARHDRAV